MLKDLLEVLRIREEQVELGGHKLVVRELQSAADVAALADNQDLGYKLLVRCVFDEAGAPAFTDDDIPALKAGSKSRLAPLMAAVTRVNGFDSEANAKNSAAVQG